MGSRRTKGLSLQKTSGPSSPSSFKHPSRREKGQLVMYNASPMHANMHYVFLKNKQNINSRVWKDFQRKLKGKIPL